MDGSGKFCVLNGSGKTVRELLKIGMPRKITLLWLWRLITLNSCREKEEVTMEGRQ